MSPVRLRLALALAAVLCVALALPAFAPARTARAAQVPCANVDLQPTADNLGAVRAAVLCLHNRDRAAHGLPPLRENARLRRAAVRHSRDMVTRRYVSHDGPDGDRMADRIKRAGYLRPGHRWTVGENIAWCTLATAADIHDAWMNSPEHRANILRRSFREVGVGIVLGNPAVLPAEAGATYTADFGVRR